MSKLLSIFIVVFTTSFLASPILNLIDNISPTFDHRMYVISAGYIALFIISILLNNKYSYFSYLKMKNFDKIILVIFAVINMIISIKLFTNNYLTQTLDFGPHIILADLIKQTKQPFLGTNFNTGSSQPFYPLGGLYQITTISYLTNFSALEIMKFTYILIASLIWPITLWLYVQTFELSDQIKSKIWIIGLTFNHMPYGYFYWGHLPTVISILLAMILEILISKLVLVRYKYWLTFIFALVIIFLVHPVGVATLFVLVLIRKLMEEKVINQGKREVGKAKYAFVSICTAAVVTLTPLLLFSRVRYQVQQNLEKLYNGTTFEYNISIWQRFLNFLYEWIINLKYINAPTLDFFYIIILIVTITMFARKKYILILITQVMLILSTAASQQNFPLSLLALPTFVFYSSASRMSHLTIIIYVLVIGKLLHLSSQKKIVIEVITNKYVLLMYLIAFNMVFYANLK